MFGESFISINLEMRWCNLLNRLLSYDLCTLVFKKKKKKLCYVSKDYRSIPQDGENS